MNEVAIKETTLPTTIEPNQILSKVMEIASNPNVNPEMFDRLVAWQERETARQAEMAFNTAMNLAQAEIAPIARTAENKQTNSFYAKLETVDAEIRPIYLKHGFSLSYNAVAPLNSGEIRIECRCAHSAGHSEKYYREAPADTLGPKGAPVKTVLHGGGSTETFLKRYLACGIFNVVFKNQDDDGIRGGMKFLSAVQYVELKALIDKGVDQVGFLRYAGVDSLEEIEAKNYPMLLNMLQRKVKELEAATEASK
jgi:hypothetical protein